MVAFFGFLALLASLVVVPGAALQSAAAAGVCAPSYTITGTPGGWGFFMIAYNANTGRVIPFSGQPTWGVLDFAWNQPSGATPPSITSNPSISARGITTQNPADGSLIGASPTAQPAGGEYSVTVNLASADTGSNAITEGDAAAGKIVVSVWALNGIGTAGATAPDVVKSITVSCGSTSTSLSSVFSYSLAPAFQVPLPTVTDVVTLPYRTPDGERGQLGQAAPYTVTAGTATGGTATATDANSDGTWDLVATPSAGYTFSGWSCSASQSPASSSSASTTITPTADTTCTPSFTAITPSSYTVTAGTATGGSAMATDNGSNSWSLVATPSSGYTFSGWSCDASQSPASSSSASTTITVTANTTCTPLFTASSSSGGGGGGGGGGSSPSTTPTTAPTTAPTPAPSVAPSAEPQAPNLEPVLNTVNPNIPAPGLPAGESVLLVNGAPAPVTVAPNAPRQATGLRVEGDGWRVSLVGRGDTADPLGLTAKQVLILQSPPETRSVLRVKAIRPVAQAAGTGFKAESPVKFYILPSSYMGELTTNGVGSFAGELPVPPGLAPGSYTLQMNGLAPDGAVRSLSIGVIVQRSTMTVRTYKAGTKVYFASLSPVLDTAAKAKLTALVRKTGTSGVRSMVVGYVQPTGTSSNDQTLSTQRATNVAAYLRGLGLKGAYVVRGDGRAQESGGLARRVNVVVSYAK